MFPAGTDLDTKFTFENEKIVPLAEESPFNVLFFGDWSGRKSDLANDAEANFLPVEIDRDNFGRVLRKLRVSLDLDFSGSGENTLSLEFSDLDDFHPDKIFQSVSLFSNLRDIRKKLANPDTYNEAAGEVRSWLVSDDAADFLNLSGQNETAADAAVSQNDLLDRIIGQTAAESLPMPEINGEHKELRAFIRKIVAPHLIKVDAEEQSNLLLVVDEIISDLMRKIIHHPEFQALESSWRGIYLLVRRIETSKNLKIFILDLDKSQILNDLKCNDDLTQSNTFKLMTDPENQWSIACCNYTFGLSVDDAAALIRLMKIGFNCNIPFISHAQTVFGLESSDNGLSTDKFKIAEHSKEATIWKTLRSLSEAEYLGLALPRFLGRLPYGEKTDPIESFHFEELTSTVRQEQFLWINPSFLCALLLAQSFNEFGWNFPANLIQDVDDLPLYYYQEETETKAKSCTEFVLTQTNAELSIEQGLIPLISFRDTDRVRVGRFQSIAVTEKMLKGKWNV